MLILFLDVSCANSARTISVPANIGATSLTIYDDTLAQGWGNWSWNSTVNLVATNTIHTGNAAIATTANAGWSGFSIRASLPIATDGYSALAFWIYGNGAPLAVFTQSADTGPEGTLYEFTPAAGGWTEVVIPLSALGSPTQIARITWHNRTPNPQNTYFVDDIRLLGDQAPPPETGITLHVDVAAARKPISPYIYGMNEYGTSDEDMKLLEELDLPLRRWGGNATSRYNWQNDISNHASDWFFNNLKQSDASNLPNDSAVNRFINHNRQAQADTLLVLPLSGYVSNDNGFACGFSMQKYGQQEANAGGDGRPDCGNGIDLNGNEITGNDPLDTSIAIDPNFVAEWVNYLVGRYGRAGAGGIRFYNYDNEPDLWFETHRDVRPTGYTYDEIRDLTYQYGAAIKDADPTAALLGPVAHGWTYYWHSPFDGQRQDWVDPDDRNAHGGTPFVAWYLQQMRAYEEANDVRILDYLDLHYYPQASSVALASAGDAATQAKRLRTTRSLWDAAYVDESWIADAGPEGGIVRLIPRMREWVAAHYPGTKLAIGEYNWGGLEHINGSLAQADILGIFGREGLDLATLWQPPQLNQPGAFAFRIYRNYDNVGGKYGDTSVAASSSDQARLSLYAAQRNSDGALTLLIINKSAGELSAPLSLDNFAAAGPVQLYRYSEANLAAIVRGADLAITNGQIAAAYPANSITLLVIPQQIEQTFDTWVRLPLMSR